jgi:hypothetical protein
MEYGIQIWNAVEDQREKKMKRHDPEGSEHDRRGVQCILFRYVVCQGHRYTGLCPSYDSLSVTMADGRTSKSVDNYMVVVVPPDPLKGRAFDRPLLSAKGTCTDTVSVAVRNPGDSDPPSGLMGDAVVILRGTGPLRSAQADRPSTYREGALAQRGDMSGEQD